MGADDDFDPPCDGVLERVEGWAVPVYRTDEHGAVEIVTDGARVWAETAR